MANQSKQLSQQDAERLADDTAREAARKARAKKNQTPESGRRLHHRTFQLNRVYGNQKYWICKTPSCFAKAYSLDDGELRGEEDAHADHCHPEPERDEDIAMHEYMMKEMEEQYQNPEEVFEKAAKRFPNAALRISKVSKTSSLKRHRLKSFPPCCKDYQEFLNFVGESRYDSMLVSDSTDQSIKAHVVDDGISKHIIFYNKDFIEKQMNTTSHLFIDGTFQCRPGIKGIAQILNIMGIKNGVAALMFQVVMSSRTKVAYDAVFQFVRKVCNLPNLKIVMSDFEQPLRASIRENFPQAHSVGCNVHFDRAIYARLKKLKIDVSDEATSNFIKKILALAFLAPKDIPKAFIKLKKSLTPQLANKLKEFLKYFKRFWMKIVTPEGFSIYGLSHRTNNISEQLNAQMLRIFKKAPDTNHFILAVVKIMDKSYRAVMQASNNASTRWPRYTTALRAEKLKRVWLDYKKRKELSISIEEILVRIANLKGDLKKLMKMPNEERLENGFAITETPVLKHPDPEFDSMMVLRSAMKTMERQRDKFARFRMEEARIQENLAAIQDGNNSDAADSAIAEDEEEQQSDENGGDDNSSNHEHEVDRSDAESSTYEDSESSDDDDEPDRTNDKATQNEDNDEHHPVIENDVNAIPGRSGDDIGRGSEDDNAENDQDDSEDSDDDKESTSTKANQKESRDDDEDASHVFDDSPEFMDQEDVVDGVYLECNFPPPTTTPMTLREQVPVESNGQCVEGSESHHPTQHSPNTQNNVEKRTFRPWETPSRDDLMESDSSQNRSNLDIDPPRNEGLGSDNNAQNQAASAGCRDSRNLSPRPTTGHTSTNNKGLTHHLHRGNNLHRQGALTSCTPLWHSRNSTSRPGTIHAFMNANGINREACSNLGDPHLLNVGPSMHSSAKSSTNQAINPSCGTMSQQNNGFPQHYDRSNNKFNQEAFTNCTSSWGTRHLSSRLPTVHRSHNIHGFARDPRHNHWNGRTDRYTPRQTHLNYNAVSEPQQNCQRNVVSDSRNIATGRQSSHTITNHTISQLNGVIPQRWRGEHGCQYSNMDHRNTLQRVEFTHPSSFDPKGGNQVYNCDDDSSSIASGPGDDKKRRRRTGKPRNRPKHKKVTANGAEQCLMCKIFLEAVDGLACSMFVKDESR